MANPTAEYTIRVRDGSTLNLVGELARPRQALFVRLHNNVGTWALELDADDPLASAIAADKAGIQVSRTLRDPLTNMNLGTTILFSGPRWGRVRKMQNNTLIASGFDDNLWLQGRIAYQVVSYPYPATVLALPGLLRYYKLNETSGTTATDSKSGINGTYAGSPSLAQKAIADDAALSPQFDGTNDVISAATTGLPSGNSSVYLGGWVYLTSYIIGSQMSPFWYGATTDGTRTGIYPAINDDGTLQVKSTSTSSSGRSTATISLNTPHLIGIQYDGTTMTGWVDGVQVVSFVPGTLALGTDAFQIARKATGNFMPGYIGHVIAGSGTLTSDQWLNLYNIGYSRFAASAYDNRSGAGETVIRQYVDVNAVSAINDPLGLSRVVPFLTLDTDSGRGSSVDGTARDYQLITPDGTGLLQELAQTAGLGFKVSQSGNALLFSQYVPADHTATVIFSEDIGNLADFTYQEDGPDFTQGGNVMLVAGGGEAEARLFLLRADTDSITRWGRFEGYVDGRDTSDVPTLQQRGDAALAQVAATTQASLVLAPQKGVVYGQDFDLGDKVTIVIDGTTYQDIVRGVQIELTRQGAETITPIVGTPSAEIVSALFGGFVQRKQLAQLRATVERLSRST